MVRYHTRYSPKRKELCQKYSHVHLYILKSDREASQFLNKAMNFDRKDGILFVQRLL